MPVTEKTERNEDIIRRLSRGEKLAEVARIHNISTTTTHRIFSRPVRQRRKHKMMECPFCGSDNIDMYTDAHNTVRAECADCGARGPDGSSIDEAQQLWEQRQDD